MSYVPNTELDVLYSIDATLEKIVVLLERLLALAEAPE